MRKILFIICAIAALMIPPVGTFATPVGDTEDGPKSDILGQVSLGTRMDHRVDFPT